MSHVYRGLQQELHDQLQQFQEHLPHLGAVPLYRNVPQ